MSIDTLELIQLHLGVFVPLRIREIIDDNDNTIDDHIARIKGYTGHLGPQGESLFYRIKGSTATSMDMLVDAVAVLAFCPGGIKVFGLEFSAGKDDTSSH